jgi:hypothetical protein
MLQRHATLQQREMQQRLALRPSITTPAPTLRQLKAQVRLAPFRRRRVQERPVRPRLQNSKSRNESDRSQVVDEEQRRPMRPASRVGRFF